MNEKTIQEKATEALTWFTTGERISTDTGRAIVIPKDDKPEWIAELCHKAHGDFMPDDWRYEMIHDALTELAESDEPDVYNIEPPIYTFDLLRWLSNNLNRVANCDEAVGQRDSGMVESMMAGYNSEQREVYGTVETFLEALNL